MIASFCIAAVCIVLLIISAVAQSADDAMNEQLRQQRKESAVNGSVTLENDTWQPQPETGGEREILPEFRELYEQNNDLVGWVSIPGTVIDYPVVQTTDNDFYLHRNFEKKDSFSGTIYADYEAPITSTSQGDNIILYGHNIQTGTYFASLTQYHCGVHKNLDYYKAHPLVEFDTIYEKQTYKIFAGIYMNTNSDYGKPFPCNQTVYFDSKDTFYTYLEGIYDRTQFFTDVDVKYGDEILMLYTCYYNPFGEQAGTRFIVYARKVRDGESTDVDVDKATINDNPLYFDYWYKAFGGEWGGRKWDPALLGGYSEWVSSKK